MMTIGSIIMTAIVITSGLLFGRRLLLLVRLAGLGQGSLEVDGKGRRFADLLVRGFGQQRILKKLSGYGHLIIFWGFFFLAFGAVEGLLACVFPNFSFAFLGPFYFFVNSGQDIFGLLVIGALLVSLFRRFVLRPLRFEGSRRSSAEALIIILLIIALILLFYGSNVIAPKPGWTPVTDLLRGFIPVKDSPPAAITLEYAAFTWMHHVIFLCFLVYLLYSKHSHILFALPNIFLKSAKHPGRIDKLDLENEEADSFGARNISDFSKKDLLDLFACSECGRCQDSCPAYAASKQLSPRQVVHDLKKHLLHVGPALLQGVKPPDSPPLSPNTISRESIWSCTTCRACDEACPVENSPMNKIIAIRQASVLMDGDFPEEAKTALRNMETQANPWGFPREQRSKWAQGLGVPTLAEESSVDYLLFVGCAGSYDQRAISVSRALVRILQKSGTSFAILGNEESCTGDSAKRIGNDYLAQELAHANIAAMERYGVKKIIAACPHCFNALKNEYPQYGGKYEVFHHSEFIAALLQAGKLPFRPQNRTRLQTVAFHDSCYLGRYNKIMDQPRDILARLGGPAKELRRYREESFCCGAGGGRMWMDDQGDTPINRERAKEICQSGADTVATACPFCMNMLADGLKEEDKAENIQVLDIAELVAQQLADHTETKAER